MMFLLRFRRSVTAVLVGAIVFASVPLQPVYAALVGTDRVIQQTEGSARDRVTAFMTRTDVTAQLEALGIAPAEAQARVAALSDVEIDRIAGKIDTMPAGEGAIGAIVGAFVLVGIILLITDLLGLTAVYGFTRKGALNPN
mgnify:CR=1 FL=1